MMKRFLFLAVTAVCMVSCFGDAYYEGTFSPLSSFEFPDDNKDSLFFGPSFMGDNFLAYMNADIPDENTGDIKESAFLKGGFGKSSRIIRKAFNGVPAPENTALLAEGGDGEYKNDNLFMTVFQPLTDKKPLMNSYAVYYNSVSAKMPDHDIVFMQTNGGTWTPKSCMIANTAYTIACATDGVIDLSEYPAPDPLKTDGMSKYPDFKFNRYKKTADGGDGSEGEDTSDEKGDFMRIVAKGYKGDSKTETGKVEIYLVDYIDGQNDSVLTAWKPLDLSKLGDVDYIDFDLEYSERVEEAVNNKEFPVYFCLDNVFSSVHVKM